MTGEPASASGSLISGPVVRLLHAALLLQGGVAMAREFWSGHPLEDGDRILAGVDLHERLWEDARSYPTDWMIRVLGSVESFCLRHGLEYLSFVRERMLGLHGGSLLSPRLALRFAGDFLPDLLQSPDLHLALLRLLANACAEWGGMLRLRLLEHRRTGDVVNAWLGIEFDGAGELPRDADLCSWIASILETSPCCWGGEAFDRIDLLADLQGMERLLENLPRSEGVERTARGWTQRGRELSRDASLDELFRQEGLSPGLLPPSIRKSCQQVLSSWTCPVRGREVLVGGRFMGASWGLLRATWHLDDANPMIAGLQRLIRQVTEGVSGPEWVRAEQLQRELVDGDRQRLRFVYHVADETISCNGSHLLRGVPARVLQKVLLAHSVTGRTLFEHREFRRDPDLNLDPANPNLESRLRLLAQRLAERLPGVRIEKAGRGRFQLETSIPIEYAEDGIVT